MDPSRAHAAVSADRRRTGGSGDFHCFVAFDAGGRRNARPTEPAPGPGRSSWGFSSGSFCFRGLGGGGGSLARITSRTSTNSQLFMEFLAWGLVLSCFFWVLYIALEPYVRRRWPATLVSWSRLLAGGFRDPLVGRDVLVGCLFGAFVAAIGNLGWFVPSWLGHLPAQPLSGPEWQFLGARAIIADISYSFDHCASFLQLLHSVCPVLSPGLAAQGVGGSDRIRSFVHGLLLIERASLLPFSW